MLTAGWNAVDMLLLAALLASVIVGLFRGLLFEVLSLVGWVAAYFGAQWWAVDVAAELPGVEPGSAKGLALAYALTFIGLLVAWTLAARMLRIVVHATPLKLVDRLLGAGFGLARGVVLLLAVATLALLTPLDRQPVWQASRTVLWLNLTLDGIRPILPEAIARHVPVRATGLRSARPFVAI